MRNRYNPSRRRVGVAALAALASSVLVSAASWAGFDEGKIAFDGKDYARAMQEWSAAAEHGDARAQFQLGILFEQGLGTEKNLAEALKWVRAAAENGEANAQFALGVLLARGDEFGKDPVEAAKWFDRGVASAKSGDPTAQFVLSQLYASGRGVEKDKAASLTWLRSAAEGGNAQAQTALGSRYADGRGVEENVAEAEEWFIKAAAQRDKEALRRVLPMLRHQFETAPDDTSAVAALSKAAQLDDQNAQFLLGMAYAIGRGVAADPVQACNWALIAGLKPEELAAHMDGVVHQLTAEQIESARQVAAAWRQAHPRPAPETYVDVIPMIRKAPESR